jgi:hypothetical protein
MASTTLELQLRQHLSKYLANQMTLRQFLRWFTPISLDALESSRPGLQELAGEVELRLAEYMNGDWTEDDLRRLLRPITRTYVSSLFPGQGVASVSGSASRPTSVSLSV